jgi:hypothetical protein
MKSRIIVLNYINVAYMMGDNENVAKHVVEVVLQ